MRWSFGGGKGPGPPGKTQVIWESIRNKQLDPLEKVGPPPPWKKCWSPSGTSENYNFLWNKPLAFCKKKWRTTKKRAKQPLSEIFFMTDGSGPPPPPSTKIHWSVHALIQILSLCCFIYAGMPYNNCWGLLLKRIALMTGCILYRLKVLSVKLGGVMCQNSDSK